MSCLNTQVALCPKNVESPIGVLIGLSTEDRIDDAARASHADRVSARSVGADSGCPGQGCSSMCLKCTRPQGPHGMVGVEPPQRARVHLVRGIFPLQNKLIPSREA